MAHLPRLGACGGAAVSRALQLRRMLGVCDSEHLALTEKLVIVLLGLGVEARVMIGVPGLRAGRRAQQPFVEAANPARAGIPAPVVVGAVRLLIAITNQPV